MKTTIEMAGKAFETPGIEPAFRNGFWTVTSEELERFAELVRADEREQMQLKIDFLSKAYDIVSKELNDLMTQQANEIKAAIRARGNS